MNPGFSQTLAEWKSAAAWLMWGFALCNVTTGVWISQGFCCMWAEFDIFSPLWVLLEIGHTERYNIFLFHFPAMAQSWLHVYVDHDVMPRFTDAAQEKKQWWKRKELTEFHPMNPFTFHSLGNLWNSCCFQAPLTGKIWEAKHYIRIQLWVIEEKRLISKGTHTSAHN